MTLNNDQLNLAISILENANDNMDIGESMEYGSDLREIIYELEGLKIVNLI